MSADGAPPTSPGFAAAIAAIDAANAEDPERISYGGDSHPKELLHARLVTEWVQRLDPDAGEAQLLAARAHHFRRWTMPRSEHPPGRAGYLRWRAAAGRRHAAEVGELLRSHGYGTEVVERVGEIIRKEARAADPQVQTHEDALCLVFVQTQLGDVARRLGEDAAVSVMSRTLAKMSPSAVVIAGGLDLDEHAGAVLQQAMRAAAGGH